jgi:hypothetical protein
VSESAGFPHDFVSVFEFPDILPSTYSPESAVESEFAAVADRLQLLVQRPWPKLPKWRLFLCISFYHPEHFLHAICKTVPISLPVSNNI